MLTRSVLRLAAIVVLVVLSLAYARTLAPSITWANFGLDSGELATAALVQGVAHPSGYPTYLLLAKLFLLLPGTEPAFKLNLLSATAAILTTLVLLMTIAQLAPPSPWRSLAAALAALTLGLAPLFWSQALITEVYTLSALFAMLLLRASLLHTLVTPPPPLWHAPATSLLAGLALGNHLAVLPFSLIWLAVALRSHHKWHTRSLIIGCFALGLLVYLILPFRAVRLPPINWGGAYRWEGFWWLVSGQLYTGMAFGIPAAELPVRFGAILQTLFAQLGWAGVVLIVYGLLRFCSAGSNLVRWLSLLPATLIVAFTLGYASYDAQVYLVVALPALVLWVGLGLATWLAHLTPQAGPPLAWSTRLPWLALLSVAAALLLGVPAHLREVDASVDQRASNYARTILNQAPDRSLIFTFYDHDSFPLWYYHFGQSLRPDLVLVAAPLLGFEWYRESLRATYPHLLVPEEAPLGWEQTITLHYAEQGPVCRTQRGSEPVLVCVPATP